MTLGKLGTVDTGGGSLEYQPWNNPLLQQGVMGINPRGFGSTPMTPDLFATPLASAAIAQAVKGEVITDPRSVQWNTTASSTPAIKMPPTKDAPNGTIENAGYLCRVMGNDIAYASPRAKSWEICALLKIVPFDETVADKIWTAIFEEG